MVCHLAPSFAKYVPDPRLTGIPDKDNRSKNDRNSGMKDSGEGRKVGGGRWSPTGDTTKTQGDRVPYATSKGSNPDKTRKEERRARSSQGRIDQEHEYGESDKVKNSDPGVEVDTPEKPEVEWVKDGMKLKKGKSPNEDRSPVKIDPGLLEPEPELGQNWSGVGENGTGRNTRQVRMQIHHLYDFPGVLPAAHCYHHHLAAILQGYSRLNTPCHSTRGYFCLHSFDLLDWVGALTSIVLWKSLLGCISLGVQGSPLCRMFAEDQFGKTSSRALVFTYLHSSPTSPSQTYGSDSYTAKVPSARIQPASPCQPHLIRILGTAGDRLGSSQVIQPRFSAGIRLAIHVNEHGSSRCCKLEASGPTFGIHIFESIGTLLLRSLRKSQSTTVESW
ncbi:hypothetical protein FB45DRAFT_1097343 [Roridomyces roridus]|uniref:Uncharacterized protein n=1 Tax=Roridomyces roridus TaxID=1738132 RepID=A0AAD7BEE7_9AGAR|nr:hypothetical protein FB45DRAFT_1097343 [Roridomyces roridus]